MSIWPLKLVLPLLTLAAAFATADTGGAADRKYPPYPDVWGRVLPVPEEAASTIYMEILDNPDGDRLLVFAHADVSQSREDPPSLWQSLTFMGDELRRMETEEVNRFFDARRSTGLYENLDEDKLTLSDGRVVRSGSREFGGSRCAGNYYTTIEIRDASGNVLVSKMLFRWYDTPQRFEIWRYCSIADGVGHYTADADAQFPVFVPLDDETFLVHTSHDKFVVRFKPDLTSLFIDNKTLFLVETAVIDQLVKDAYRRPGQPIQNANDAIRDYLLTLRKGE